MADGDASVADGDADYAAADPAIQEIHDRLNKIEKRLQDHQEHSAEQRANDRKRISELEEIVEDLTTLPDFVPDGPTEQRAYVLREAVRQQRYGIPDTGEGLSTQPPRRGQNSLVDVLRDQGLLDEVAASGEPKIAKTAAETAADLWSDELELVDVEHGATHLVWRGGDE